MALSSVTYVGNGTTKNYNVTFSYLSQEHVKVYVNSTLVTNYTWASPTVISFITAPANGLPIAIKRDTPSTPIVDFVDGSNLTENMLDLATLQSLYLAQETKDAAANGIQLDPVNNVWEGSNKKLSNLADPVSAQDATTKNWVETAMNSPLVLAQTAANNASSSASSASTSATNAANSATTATTQAGIASTKATEASTSATNAASSATSAATSASTATTSASNAATSATGASNSASTASTHASNASASATTASNAASTATTSATNAAGSATTASTAATNAASSATSASNSASSASSSATAAASSATTATTKASEASTSATAAASSATSASTSATNAASSATSASTSATDAATSATNAANSYDAFDDRYLGAKASAPSVDNDGNALLTGALYWNTGNNSLYVWDGAAWQQAAFDVSGTGVSSFNTRTGGVTLTSTDVTNALTYTPLAPSAIGSTVQAYDATIVKTGVANTFTAQQTFKELKDTVHTITDGAAFEIDPANGSIQTVTLGASRTPAATNFEAGQIVLLGIDDGTAYTITWTTVAVTWVKAGGTASAPTLATTGFTWVLLWKVGSTIYGTEVGKP